ncbi:tetratricopeptide repeat protein [Tumebacillus sp. DT12]|uniref:Tetratricopeptide repeat protein n=1 Tax=Tumebacillus lacus TaxID=2995335 RepID=A0ABT3X6Q8_9BACL|nr:helix-turn-helix domain-containing protein [Tumebacillus lacus]MCX7571285.1 tetratricopeptide repeat protein [Tumebacillus lacus]
MERDSGKPRQGNIHADQGMSSLGKRLRELRLKKGLTQIELAEGLLTPSMISQVESDKARPSYAMLCAIAERLDVPVEKLLVNVELNMGHVSSYKMAKAMVAAKQYASAITLLRELLDAPRSTVSTTDILYHLGECLLHTGDLDEAEKTFAQVQEYAVLRNDSLLATRTLLYIGIIAFERKFFQIAQFHFGKALDESEKIAEKGGFLQADILHKLGEVSLKLGQTSKATDYFTRAAALYEGTDNLSEMADSYLQLGVSYKQLGDLERATEYSERAHSIYISLDELQGTLRLEIQTAALYGVSGREDDAEQILIYTLSKADQMKDLEMQGMAYTELAQLYLNRVELEKAVEHCENACMLLPEFHVYHAKANRILARVAVESNNIEEARHRFQMAADGFKRVDEVSEWDDTMFELSRLSLLEADYQHVIGVLEEIRGYTRQVIGKMGIRL